MAEEKMSRRLFVGGLYDGITEKDLSDRFRRFGEVSAVDIRARKDNLGNILKTFAYLNMAITEKDYKKCMATFNKTTWRGNEMQIQLAKESFMDRLAREREAAKKQEICSPVNPVVEPVSLQVKGAVPGTAVEGKEDWVVGKYGRALPVVNIRTKNKKKVLKIDPSKYVHGVKKFDHGKKAEAMETDPSTSVNGLTWHLDVEETETLKKIKGEFPQSKKTSQKRKHSISDDSTIGGKAETTFTRDYHSNSDSCTSDDETPQVTKKKKSALKRDLSISEEKPTTKVQTPKTPLVNGKRKRTISDTSSPYDGKDTRPRALSPNVSIIEPQLNATPTRAQKPSAVDILKRLKVSTQKKEIDLVATKGISPKKNKLSSATKGQNLSSPVSETEKTTWSPSIDVGSAEQSVKPHTPKAMDILEKLKLASQQKQIIKDTPVVKKQDKDASVVKDRRQSAETKTKTPNTADILEKLKRKQKGDDIPSSKISADSIDNGSAKQKGKPKTPNTTDILEKLKRKQNLENTPTTTKCVTSETSSDDDLPPKTTGQKVKKKSQLECKSQKEDVSSNSDSEDEGSLRKANKKPKSPKVPAVLKMETGIQEKVPQKSKKAKSQKNTPTTSMVKVIQFDDDIGVEADDEDDVNNRRHKPRQPLLRRNPTIAQPAFAQVGSVDEFGVGMLVDEKTRPLSEQEKKWKKYNSNSYSSDEDILDAAKAGSFTKLDRIAKLAQLGQKHIEIPAPLTSSTLPGTGQKVYNSDSNSDDECFTQVQTMPKRLKEKSLPSNTKNIQERQQHLPSALVQQQTVNKDNSLTSKKTQVEASKQPESSDESSTMSSDSDSEEVKISKTKGNMEKSSKENSESSSEDSSEAEEAITKSPVQKVGVSGNVSHTKQKAQVKKGDTSDSSSESSTSSEEVKQKCRKGDSLVNKEKLHKGDTPESLSESSTSSADEETIEVKQKPKALCKKSSPVINKKGKQEDNSTSSSESSSSSEGESRKVAPQVLNKKNNTVESKKQTLQEETSSSDEETVEEKQKPKAVNKKGSPVDNIKVVNEDNSTSSSESSTSSDEEVSQVGKKDDTLVNKKGAANESSSESCTSSDETTQVKPQVVQSKKNNTSVSKKEALKEQSSTDSSTSSDEEPTPSKPATKKQKLLQQSEEPKGATTKDPTPAVKDQLSDTLKPKPEKPKVIKSKQAVNQQRLESLKLRNQETLAQKNLLKKALASVDANTSNSKKIIFDSDSEDEKMKMLDTSSSSESDSGDDSDTESSDEESEPKPVKAAAAKKPALFDDDDDEESEGDAEDQFRVRPQFEGEAGSKLIALQSRFGNDPRFKFTEKFLDSDNEEHVQDSGAEEEMEVTEETTVAERDRTLAILKDVVGQADSKTKKTKAVLFKDMATQQYDPTKDEHKQFEVQVEKKEKKKKKKEVPAASEAEPLPEVSGDRYFEVQNSLKDMFTKTDDKPFSLLAMLGRAEDEPPAKGFSQQADGKGQAFQHIKSPWEQQFGSDGDSSGDERGDTQHDDTSVFKSAANNDSKNKSDSARKSTSHGFFFVDNDPRIADGIDFFRRQEDIEKIREKWTKERPDLVEAYRNKRKRFRFMKKEGTTPNYKAGFKPRGGKRGGVRGRR